MTDHTGDAPPKPRRDFLNVAIACTATALGAAAGYPVLSLLPPVRRASPKAAPAGKVDSFEVGTARALLVGQRPALVLRLPDGQFRAFVAVCPHLDCIVYYAPGRHRIECPCHSGVFDLDGSNVSGPPPRPLRPLAVSVVDGEVLVSET
jgi:cytochrome b6-f complex iron-sulfur subunit